MISIYFSFLLYENTIIKVLNDLDYEEISDHWKLKKTAFELIRYVKVEHSDFILIDILIGSDSIYKEILKRSIRQRTGSGTVKLASAEYLIYLKKTTIVLRIKLLSKIFKTGIEHDKIRKSKKCD
jgi:hypothetical protein